ncbi:MAG TPA: hypothetical protein VF144_18125 [Chitinophagaceae bacterium]
MKIDRHNYEVHFILYWDDELTVSEKQAVDDFVKENPDLREEFNLLGETRFIPDNDVQFSEKEFLQNNSYINVTNYEEQLLNYIDDEVNPGQRKEVEKFLSQYPAGQRELELLQKTKLQPEAAIVFPDKSILYRKEEKVPVISMTWFRVAVAAAIILVAGFATFRLISTNKNGDTPVVVKISEPKKQLQRNDTADSIDSPADQVKDDLKETLAKIGEKSTQEKPITIDKKVNKLPLDKYDDQQNLAINRPENKNNLPKEGKNIDQQSSDLLAEADLPYIKRDTRSAQTNQSDAINTSIGESDVTHNTIPTLYIPEQEQEEKGGLKEFLRKTTRAFERRTKIQTTTDDNKLLVGAFAVSLK